MEGLPPKLKRWLVYAVLAAVMSGSLWAAISGRERWPFSPYPMYAWVEVDRSVKRLQLCGVRSDRSDQEVPLAALRYLRPFDDARLSAALWRLWDTPEQLGEALRYCLRRYEWLRRHGRHQGPPIEAIRLYVYEWSEIDPWARDADHPEFRTLAFETGAQNGNVD